MILSALLIAFGALRLAEGVVCIALGVRLKRRAVLIYGVLAAFMAPPVIGLGAGWDIPQASIVTLAGLHAVKDALFIAATLSSTGVLRDLSRTIRDAGGEVQTGWRP